MESTWTVEGMTCGHCAASVREEVEEIDGVTSVAVDHESGAVVVTSERPVNRDDLSAAVAEAGYTLV